MARLHYLQPEALGRTLAVLAQEFSAGLTAAQIGVVQPRLSALTQKDHFGIVGMAERVAWAGGTLQITSAPGNGTRLEVRIPRDEKENGHDRDDSCGARR